jgi:uncharacterized protein YuzE
MRRTDVDIRYSTEAEAFYVTLSEGDIDRTVHISDDVLVDLEADGTVVGLELLCAPTELTSDERTTLTEPFPAAAEALQAVDRLTRLSA